MPEHCRVACCAAANRLSVEPGLLERHPEHGRGHEQHGDHDQPLPLLRRPLADEEQPGEERDGDQQEQRPEGVRATPCGGEAHDPGPGERHQQRRRSRRPPMSPPSRSCRRWRRGRVVSAGPGRMPALPQVLPPPRYWTRPQNIPTAAGAEAPVPGALGRDPQRPSGFRLNCSLCASQPRDQRRDERAGVDPHVVDRVAGVAAHVLRRVELADQTLTLGLSSPVPMAISTRPR